MPLYFWLVVAPLIVWLVLLIAAIAGYRKSAYGGFTLTGAVGLITVAAVAVILFTGPYWMVIYRTILQPG